MSIDGERRACLLGIVLSDAGLANRLKIIRLAVGENATEQKEENRHLEMGESGGCSEESSVAHREYLERLSVVPPPRLIRLYSIHSSHIHLSDLCEAAC
jgi:hypothetical protein